MLWYLLYEQTVCVCVCVCVCVWADGWVYVLELYNFGLVYPHYLRGKFVIQYKRSVELPLRVVHSCLCGEIEIGDAISHSV